MIEDNYLALDKYQVKSIIICVIDDLKRLSKTNDIGFFIYDLKKLNSTVEEIFKDNVCSLTLDHFIKLLNSINIKGYISEQTLMLINVLKDRKNLLVLQGEVIF